MKAKDFDIFEMAQGTTYPKDSVAIYFDQETAYNISQLDERLNSSEKYSLDEKEINKLEKERAELLEKLNESRVYIHAQGVPTTKTQELYKEMDEKYGSDKDNAKVTVAKAKETFTTLALLHLKKAVFSDGTEQDISNWDFDKMQAWLDNIPRENNERIDQLILKLLFMGKNFENIEVNSDFL